MSTNVVCVWPADLGCYEGLGASRFCDRMDGYGCFNRLGGLGCTKGLDGLGCFNGRDGFRWFSELACVWAISTEWMFLQITRMVSGSLNE